MSLGNGIVIVSLVVIFLLTTLFIYSLSLLVLLPCGNFGSVIGIEIHVDCGAAMAMR